MLLKFIESKYNISIVIMVNLTWLFYNLHIHIQLHIRAYKHAIYVKY